MFARYLFLLFAVVFFAAVAVSYAAEEEEPEVSDEAEDRNPALALAVAALRAVAKWAAKNCLEDAAKHCKQHWKNPGELARCGKNYLQTNKGRCVAG